MSDIDDERIKKYLGSVEERINFAKENGCKLLDCKVIDENIKLRQENIKLKKIAEKLAEECTMFKKIQQIDLDNEYSNGLVYMTKEEVLYWARKEVEKDDM